MASEAILKSLLSPVWQRPSAQSLEQEYMVEYLKHFQPMYGNSFPTKESFIDAAQAAPQQLITPEMDSLIDYRSHTPDMESLLNLIRSYRSYPKYRNEQTIGALDERLRTGQPVDLPIVAVDPAGKQRVFSGNTRMDLSMQNFGNASALMLPVPDRLFSLPGAPIPVGDRMRMGLPPEPEFEEGEAGPSKPLNWEAGLGYLLGESWPSRAAQEIATAGYRMGIAPGEVLAERMDPNSYEAMQSMAGGVLNMGEMMAPAAFLNPLKGGVGSGMPFEDDYLKSLQDMITSKESQMAPEDFGTPEQMEQLIAGLKAQLDPKDYPEPITSQNYKPENNPLEPYYHPDDMYEGSYNPAGASGGKIPAASSLDQIPFYTGNSVVDSFVSIYVNQLKEGQPKHIVAGNMHKALNNNILTAKEYDIFIEAAWSGSMSPWEYILKSSGVSPQVPLSTGNTALDKALGAFKTASYELEGEGLMDTFYSTVVSKLDPDAYKQMTAAINKAGSLEDFVHSVAGKTNLSTMPSWLYESELPFHAPNTMEHTKYPSILENMLMSDKWWQGMKLPLAEREARRIAGGYTVPAVRGTRNPMTQAMRSEYQNRGGFPEYYFFPQEHADLATEYGPYIYPMWLKMQNPLDIDYSAVSRGLEHSWDFEDSMPSSLDELMSMAAAYPPIMPGSATWNSQSFSIINRLAQQEGHDSVKYRNVRDLGGSGLSGQTQLVTFDPRQAKSRFAKIFDPEDPDILWSLAGAPGIPGLDPATDALRKFLGGGHSQGIKPTREIDLEFLKQILAGRGA